MDFFLIVPLKLGMPNIGKIMLKKHVYLWKKNANLQ